VVDNTALRKALSKGIIAGAVLDVWEGEPDADPRLIDLTDIATPHIAGYSVDGKANATIKVVHEVSSALGLPLTNWIPLSLPAPEDPDIDLDNSRKRLTPLELAGVAVKKTYPVEEDDLAFRNEPAKFESLRDNYRKRREFSSYNVMVKDEEVRETLSALGFNLK